MTALSLPQALQRLADFRATDRRASQETFDHGVLALKNNAHGKMGDESGGRGRFSIVDSQLTSGLTGWAFLEQLALASIDIGRVDVADVCLFVHFWFCLALNERRGQRCLQLLSNKFPGSPRVDCLTGIRMEATESTEVVLNYYNDRLRVDPANGVSLSTFSFSTLRLVR